MSLMTSLQETGQGGVCFFLLLLFFKGNRPTVWGKKYLKTA